MNDFKPSNNSWHYKMLKKWDRSMWPEDFCSYWRRVMFIIALGIGFCFSAAAVFGVVLFWIFCLIGSLMGIVPMPLGILIWIATIILGTMICWDKIKAWKHKRNNKKGPF